MTQYLAPRAAHLVAIETDAGLALRLREKIAAESAQLSHTEVVTGDVLRQNIGALVPGRFRVYGNLPYYITSPILHHLFEFADRIDSIHIVIQFEVAARIAARPGRREYGYLSVACQFFSDPEIVLRIPPGAFRPAPRVTSALVRMSLPGARARIDSSTKIADENRFLKFVQVCFAQKRKTLRNNLRAIAGDERIHAALNAANLPADARAEQLSIPDFAKLFSALT